jgi:hypothetical protein
MNLIQEALEERLRLDTRRHFLQRCSTGLGALWLASQTGGGAWGAGRPAGDPNPLAPMAPHFAPRAKRIIFLHMSGGPSQLELFDYKPELETHDGESCSKEFMQGKRFAFITGIPKMLGPRWPFHQAGESGQWISDRMPNLEQHIDDICFIKSMHTDQFNHAPAQLLMHTGSVLQGKPSIGAWSAYGLGSENRNLPGFIVLVSGGSAPDAGKSAWASGFLPSVYQGVQCRSKGSPVLYLENPDGISRNLRRRSLDALNDINQQTYEEVGDPETLTRIVQYEMAFRMQAHASEAFDITKEPDYLRERYGVEPGKESFANNCLLARRLVERGVRFVQLFDWGWDHHGTSQESTVEDGLAKKCKEIDQPIAALLTDLKERGLLDETLVVWGGEFGRTPMRENRAGKDNFAGRDHHPHAFTLWMAGAGVKPGFTYGETDPIGYSVAKDPVHIRDLHATLVHLLGFDHKHFTYPFQGLDQRLTGVVSAKVVNPILA